MVPFSVNGERFERRASETDAEYTARALAATPVVNGRRMLGPVLGGA